MAASALRRDSRSARARGSPVAGLVTAWVAPGLPPCAASVVRLPAMNWSTWVGGVGVVTGVPFNGSQWRDVQALHSASGVRANGKLGELREAQTSTDGGPAENL